MFRESPTDVFFGNRVVALVTGNRRLRGQPSRRHALDVSAVFLAKQGLRARSWVTVLSVTMSLRHNSDVEICVYISSGRV